MKTLDKQKKERPYPLRGGDGIVASLGMRRNKPTANLSERSDYYTRGIGQYPGDLKDRFLAFSGSGSFHLP